jgi:hypothetical protein
VSAQIQMSRFARHTAGRTRRGGHALKVAMYER